MRNLIISIFIFFVIRSLYRLFMKPSRQTRDNYDATHRTGNYNPYQNTAPKETEKKPVENTNIVDAQFTDLPDDKGK